MKNRAMAEKLYGALFEISALREEVHALRPEMTCADESRFLLRLDVLEAAAVRLVDDVEKRRPASSH